MKHAISSLQTLRAIGAILIFIPHYRYINQFTATFGDCGVNWFMTLSGFVLCAAYGSRISSIRIWQFLKSRFRRVAPLYYTSLALMLAIIQPDFGRRALCASLLMVQSWFSDYRIFFSFNEPSWFISDLMFCYLLFIPLYRLITKYPKSLWAIIVVGATAYFTTIAATPADSALYLIYIYPPMQLASFVAGMLLWQLYTHLRSAKMSPAQANALILGAFVLVVISITTSYLISPKYTLSSYWWPSTWVLIIILAITDPIECMANKVMHARPLRTFGNASLCFYLFQLPWILLTKQWLEALGIEMPLWVELPASILLLALISCMIHRLLNRWNRSKILCKRWSPQEQKS